MSKRSIRAYVFCSAKGGVGKSTLAIVTALLLAKRGYRNVVLDGDFTGTSLADGLRLCAPRVHRLPTGLLDIKAPPTGRLLDWEATRQARLERSVHLKEHPEQYPWALPYLNDALTFLPSEKGGDCRLDAMLWHLEADRMSPRDAVAFIPSSSTQSDVSLALRWLQGLEMDLRVRRLREILEALVMQLPDLTDVIVDLPPGIAGFTQNFLQVLHQLYSSSKSGAEDGGESSNTLRWELFPFLVTSQDRNDLQVALEYYLPFSQVLPGLVPIVNRLKEHKESLNGWVDATFAQYKLTSHLRYVDFYEGSLDRLFLHRDVRLPDKAETLARTLRVPEAQ